LPLLVGAEEAEQEQDVAAVAGEGGLSGRERGRSGGGAEGVDGAQQAGVAAFEHVAVGRIGHAEGLSQQGGEDGGIDHGGLLDEWNRCAVVQHRP
jgi:hypothetical protein